MPSSSSPPLRTAPSVKMIDPRHVNMIRTALANNAERFEASAKEWRDQLANASARAKLETPGAPVTVRGAEYMINLFGEQAELSREIIALMDGPDAFEGVIELALHYIPEQD
jgi:hypothetical protein